MKMTSIQHITNIWSGTFQGFLSEDVLDSPDSGTAEFAVLVFGASSLMVGILGACYNVNWMLWGFMGLLEIPAGWTIIEKYKNKLKWTGHLSKKLRKKVAAFNNGLRSRKALEPIVRKLAESTLYEEEVQQWNIRRDKLVDAITLELEAVAARRVLADNKKILRVHRKDLKQIESALAVLEKTDPATRNTLNYASLITAAMVDQHLNKE